MSKLADRYHEDKLLRDAALSVVKSDIEHLRENFSAKRAATRISSRIGLGAAEVLETAKEQAEDHRGIIAALIGAILLWFGRHPILDALGLSDPQDEHSDDETPPGDNHG